MTRPPARPGFSLLEVILSLAIATMLLGALYVALDIQIQNSQAGREVVEQSNLSRALLARMGTDLSQAVALSDPGRFSRQSSGTGGMAGGGGMTGGGMTGGATATAPATGATGTDMAATDPAAATTAEQPNVSLTGPVTIPLGVQGDAASLTVFVSRTPREALGLAAAAAAPRMDEEGAAAAPLVSDLRRVTYWLVEQGEGRTGLARQEAKVITSDEALDNIPPGIDNEEAYIIGPEVTNLSFSYFDGTAWVDSWDATQPGADGVTPVGNPRAIAVTLTLRRPTDNGLLNDRSPVEKTFRHVIALPTANGAASPGTATDATTGAGTAP